MVGNICVFFSANVAYMRDFGLVLPEDCIASNTVCGTYCARIRKHRPNSIYPRYCSAPRARNSHQRHMSRRQSPNLQVLHSWLAEVGLPGQL